MLAKQILLMCCTAMIACLATTSGLLADNNNNADVPEGQMAVHPDLNFLIQSDPSEVSSPGHPELVRTSIDDDCSTFGDWSIIAGGRNMFRGDVFTVDAPRYLTEFSMELNFTGEATLWFYVFEKGQSDYYQLAVREVVIEGVGRSFYNSGQFDPPLALTPDTNYVIGVGWGNDSMTFAYKNQGSTSFGQGTLKGLTSLNSVQNPISDTQSFLTYTSAAYSMDVCFQPLPGACCLPNGTCQEMLHIMCLAQGGDYTANGVECSDIDGQCPLDKGACCFTETDGCYDMNMYACNERGGDYKGDNSSCAQEACHPRGACCVFHLGQCFEGMTEDECYAEDPYGKNKWTEAASCSEVLCVPLGSCCVEGNTCLDDMIDTTCTGDFHLGATCDPNPCVSAEGACCHFDGTCSYETEFGCFTLGGTYNGDDTICGSNGVECTTNGACCYNNGENCSVLSKEECAEYTDSVFHKGLTCTPSPCQGPTEQACCIDGECVMNNQTDCEAEGGTWLVDYEACTNGCTPVGACCMGDDGCQSVTEAECTQLGGEYLGDGSYCFNCATGACCSYAEPCVQVRRHECETSMAGIDFLGEFTQCEVNTCGFCDDYYPGAEYGDYNADRVIGDLDLQAFTACQTQPDVSADNHCRCAFDFDYDTDVDMEDYTIFENMYCPTCCTKHDWNRDGQITGEDFEGFAHCMAGPGVQPNPPVGFGDTYESCLCVFDTDMDNDVDLADFISFQSSLTTAP